jgi:hypothetical protein
MEKNLFSVGTIMKKGWQMWGDDQGVVISKAGVQLVFDIVFPTPMGILYAMYLKRGLAEVTRVGTEQVSMLYRKAHEVLGHMSGELVKKTAQVSCIVASTLPSEVLFCNWNVVGMVEKILNFVFLEYLIWTMQRIGKGAAVLVAILHS